MTIEAGPSQLPEEHKLQARGIASTVRERFWVIGPVGLLLAYFWQPAFRFIAPFILTSISSLLVFGLVLAARGASVAGRRLSRLLYLCSFVLFATGIGEAIYFATLGLAVSDANDTRCLSIENHMLATETGRARDATLFQALGCRPQSDTSVKWPGRL